MDVISDVKLVPCIESKYINPIRMHYEQVNVIYVSRVLREIVLPITA